MTTTRTRTTRPVIDASGVGPEPAAVAADVIVVGAGPTGLLLAGDLAEAGVRVILLEKRGEESNLTRAFAVHARTLEMLDARGLADRLVETGAKVDGLRLFGSLSMSLSELPTRFPYALVTPQYNVERLLRERAEAAGVVIRRGATVETVDQDGTGVTVTHLDGAGSTWRERASYVVGADGHRSTVRDSIGLPFPGESVLRSLMLADVRLAHPPDEVITVGGNRHGFVFIAPFGDGWHRVIARASGSNLPDDVPASREEVRAVVRGVFGHDFGMGEARWTSRFHSDERQAPHYRVGRVLLAGDAAHVHSPAGGMGMNTGLQDAANLGWKLAVAVRNPGEAAERLLDSYEAERHPVGEMVLRVSGGLLRAAMVRTAPARALRNTVARVVLRTPVADRGRQILSGIGVRYPAPLGSHPLVGTRAPDVVGDDGRRLAEALRGGRFVLVTPEAATSYDGVLAVLARAGQAMAVLVRPDGYVGWVGQPGDDVVPVLAGWGVPVGQVVGVDPPRDGVEPPRASAAAMSDSSSVLT